jgi:hypothetical protein
MRATKIYPGMWEVTGLGKYYRYRVFTKVKGDKWKVYKISRKAPDGNSWVFVVDGFRSKASAVEYAVEQAGRDDDSRTPINPKQAEGRVIRDKSKKNPVADLLNNIDDSINLNNEGWDD